MASSLTPKRVDTIISLLDWGKRTEVVAEVWPEFPRLVSERFHGLWKQEGNKAKCRDRHEAIRSRVRKGLPMPDILLWEQELFETALHEELSGVNNVLWRRGEWTPDAIAKLAQVVLPPTRLHVAWWHSRTVRPRLPLPVQTKPGQFALDPIEQEDEFKGWFQVGCLEKQLIFADSPLADCLGYVTCSRGTVFAESGDISPETCHVFGAGDAVEGWSEPPPLQIQVRKFTGPLVGVESLDDFIGRKNILMLHPHMLSLCQLSPGRWPGRIAMADTTGQLAVVFRHWRVRPVGERMNEACPQLVGCDLVVRPDIVERIQDITVGNCCLVTKVHERRYGTDPPEK